MKIGLFCTWLSQTKGGIENVCYNFFMTFKNSGYDIKAFSLNIPEEEKQNSDVYYSTTSKRTIPLFSFYNFYKKENKISKFDLNVAFHWGMGIFALIMKLLYKTPYIIFVYGKEIAYFKTPISKFLIKQILNNSKCVVAISEYTKQLAENLNLTTEIIIVHPGIDKEIIDEISFNQDYDYSKKPIKLFYIGRLVKRKGIDKTLEAVKLLLDDGYDVTFDIGGGGEYLDELLNITERLDIKDKVRFLGRISVDDKIKNYKNCYLFVMPSYEIKEEKEVEGFGIVYVESNAFGKFVIAGNSGGISDAVIENKTGYTVDGNNPLLIKEGIIKYINMPIDEKIKLSELSKEWAQKHSWDILVKDIEKFI